MKKNYTYYLAHTTTLLKKTRKWQLYLESRFDITFVNPFQSNPNERAEDLIKVSKSNKALTDYMKNLTMTQCLNIRDRDLELIRKADGVVAYFDSPSIGTICEIFYASYILRMPVYLITNDWRWHCWLRTLVTKSFRTKTEFKQYLIDIGLEKTL